MPEPDLALALSGVRAEWRSLQISGAGQLRLTSTLLEVDVTGRESLIVRYADLAGGGLRSGALTVHGEAGSAVLEAPSGLETAWALLVQRACPLPEVARAHRLLGSRRGGPAELQGRLLSPLLQARRRIEEETDLDARVATLDARALRDRLAAALQAIARDAYPTSLPDRRALEAELEEAMSRVFSGLDALELAARDFRAAAEAIRFMAWRRWVSAMSNVFARADSGWAIAARLIPPSIKP